MKIKFQKIGESSVKVVEHKDEFVARLVPDELFNVVSKYGRDPFEVNDLFLDNKMFIVFNGNVTPVLVTVSDEGIKVYTKAGRIYIEDNDCMFTTSDEAIEFLEDLLWLASF